MADKAFLPTLAQLRMFVTLVENRHFGTAAEKLSITQPSLSQGLSTLEKGLDLQLIERSTRKVIVTPVGQKLVPYARAVLEAADVLEAQIYGGRESLTGQLSIGVIPTIAPYLLPEFLSIIQERFPKLEPTIIEATTPHLMENLRDGKIDVALIAFPSKEQGLTEIELYTEPFVAALPQGHEWEGREDLTLDMLNDVRLLLLNDGHCMHEHVMDLCRLAQVDVGYNSDSLSRAASLSTIIQLVAAGQGCTLLPASAVHAEFTRPGIALAQFAPSVTAERHVGLVYRKSSARAEEFAALGEAITESYEKTLASAAPLGLRIE